MTAQTSAPQVELMPCPLCHSSGDKLSFGICYVDHRNYREEAVRCTVCGCRATLRAWNTRPSPDSEGVEALEKLANDVVGIQEDLPNEDDRNTLGYAAHYLRKFAIRPQASAGERGITDAMIAAAIEAAWLGPEVIYSDEFDSAEAMMRAALEAAFSATLEPGRGK